MIPKVHVLNLIPRLSGLTVIVSGPTTRQGRNTPPQTYYAQDTNEGREIEGASIE